MNINLLVEQVDVEACVGVKTPKLSPIQDPAMFQELCVFSEPLESPEDPDLQAAQELCQEALDNPVPFQHSRRRSASLTPEMEELLTQNTMGEEEGASKDEDPIDFNDPVHRQFWGELDRLEVWPKEKKIPRTRHNGNGQLRVHFADEKGLELAEVHLQEESKRRDNPYMWFWWAVKDDEEAFQWPAFRYWRDCDCWIVNDEPFEGSMNKEQWDSFENDSPVVQQEPAAAPCPVQAPCFVLGQFVTAQASSPDMCMGLQNELPVHEECSGKAHVFSRIEVPDSQWCDVVIQRLQSENSNARNTGFMYLLSNDVEACDIEYPHVGPKNGNVIMPLALSSHGYKVILQAISAAPNGMQHSILSALKGNVNELAESSYGCEVLQSCIEYSIPSDVFFIAEELQGSACSIARMTDKYQLICRLLEHMPSNATQSLVEELLTEISALCRHPRGNHVVQHLLEYGNPSQQHEICSMIAGDLLKLARHRIASHVVEKAVDASNLAASSLVVQAALHEQGAILSLACNRQSQFVAQRLLKREGKEGHAVRCVLCANLEKLNQSKYGSRIAASLATYLGATAGA